MTINGVHTVNPQQTIHFQLLRAVYLHTVQPFWRRLCYDSSDK